MYLPSIRKARKVSDYALGPYLVSILTDCESDGLIDYLHVMIVYKHDDHLNADANRQPIMAVAAEISTMLKQMQSDGQNPAYFLGVFDKRGHANLGLSEEWADIDKFTSSTVFCGEHKSPVPTWK